MACGKYHQLEYHLHDILLYNCSDDVMKRQESKWVKESSETSPDTLVCVLSSNVLKSAHDSLFNLFL